MTSPELHAIRAGEAHDCMASVGQGCILRRSHTDGIRIATEMGDIVVPLVELETELLKLGLQLAGKGRGR